MQAVKDGISKNLNRIIMIARSSIVKKFISEIDGIDESATALYSMWSGYFKEDSMKELLKFFSQKGIKPRELHTSGHAPVATLKKVVDKTKPKMIIPIHTSSPKRYKDFFPNVVEAKDGVSLEI